jgi:hypothetical protein
MADSNPAADSGSDDGSREYPGAPRWVKITGIIVSIVVLLFLFLLVTRGTGGHGPGRHRPSAPADETAQLSGAAVLATPAQHDASGRATPASGRE